MSQALLIILGVYLLACYAYGMVVLVRLWSTKTVIRPTSKIEPTELVKAAKQELEQDEQRVAA
ncbi:MAG: hypothetical protein KTR15_03390 [Phycisphaeraceae bacterium]|nr:hypothetical protein [Phycisphaeraceae bacterium]